MKVYKFRIELDELQPKIWRQIQVPETYTFWDLHVAIQDVMGWQDYHMHQFEMLNPKTEQREYLGYPEQDPDWDLQILPDWQHEIADYFNLDNRSGLYTYDFGDEWLHFITLETISPEVPNVEYPCSLRGERACPPEDAGGARGYNELLAIISNPHHEDYSRMKEWVGKSYSPEDFDPEQVKFTDPDARLKRWLG